MKAKLLLSSILFGLLLADSLLHPQASGPAPAGFAAAFDDLLTVFHFGSM